MQGNKPPIFLHSPRKHRISVPEVPGDIDSTCAADSRAPADKVPSPSKSAKVQPTFSTCAAVNGAPVDVEQILFQCVPDSGDPAVIEPTHSSCAADTRAPADIKPNFPQLAPDSGAPADTEKLPSPRPAISESDEKFDSETGSDIGLNFIIDSDIYMEHARDIPHTPL